MTQASPQRYARLGGWLYLLLFVAATSIFVQSSLIVGGNASQTWAHIGAAQPLWRVAFAAEVLMFALDIPLAVIFYVLLRPVDANVALVAMLFRFGEAAIGVLNAAWTGVPLILLSGSAYLGAFSTRQLESLGMVSLRVHEYGAVIALGLFGVHCVLLGYLVWRSGYLPKTLGFLLIVAGFCYAVHCAADLAAPAFDDLIYPWILLPGFPAEVGFCLWLIFAGVNVPRWNERARLQSAVT